MAPFNIIKVLFQGYLLFKIKLSNQLYFKLYTEIKLLAFYCLINVAQLSNKVLFYFDLHQSKN